MGVQTQERRSLLSRNVAAPCKSSSNDRYEEADMQSPEHFQLMARYNQWMNHKLYVICAGIPDHERKKDRCAFFKSIQNGRQLQRNLIN